MGALELLQALDNILRSAGYDIDVHTFLGVFGLALARLVTLLTLSPALGGQALPGQVRIGLAVVLAAVLVPSFSVEQPLVGGVVFAALLAKEVVIGAALGFASQLVFYAIQAAGRLIDNQRGASMASLLAPQLPANVSVFGQLKFQTALVLFLVFNGHLFFIEAIAESFRLVPVTGFPAFGSGLSPAADSIGRMSADLLTIALEISAPILIVLFLIDVLMGLLNRVAPQINVFTESFPAKGLVAVGAAFLSMGLLLPHLERLFARMLGQVNLLARGLGG